MSQEIRPINHSGGSAAASTVGGAAWGGFKWGALVTAAWVIGFTALGIWGLPLLIPQVAATGFFTTILSAVTHPLVMATVGGLAGFGAGVGSSPIPAVLATSVGAIGGGVSASNRVTRERMAAQDIQTEIAMAGVGSGRGFSADPRFNQASSMIQADSADNQGRLEQLQRARG